MFKKYEFKKNMNLAKYESVLYCIKQLNNIQCLLNMDTLKHDHVVARWILFNK